MLRRQVLALLAGLLLLGCSAAAQVAPPTDEKPAARQPVYVLLFGSFRDHFNLNFAEESLQRSLAVVQHYRNALPQYRASVLLQFSGTVSEELANRNGANHLVDRIRNDARRGIIEVGYDGLEEPTFVMRPRPNFRQARTAPQRWLARSEAAEWFLTEHKDFRWGEPDPSRSGGLKKMQEVFGEAAAISGVSLELGGDPEIVHLLRRFNTRALLPGFPEPATYPARTLHGYRGSVAGVSSLMSPEKDCAPEVFWQDNVLRVSDTSGPNVRVVVAHQGLAALKDVLEKLDRSRVHVVKVQLGHPALYMRPDFAKGRYATPLDYAYENPKALVLPEEARQPRSELDAAFAHEESIVKWLAENFFPDNPGSRFVSSEDLRQMARTHTNSNIARPLLASAAANLLEQWNAQGNHPPSFAHADEDYFSLADMFQMLVSALAEFHRTGSLPESVRLNPLYGPVDMPEDQGPALGEITVGSVARICAEIEPGLNNQAWKPVPDNAVPGWVTVEDSQLNAAQFLRLMAEAYASPTADKKLSVKTSQMYSPAGEGFPRSRLRSEVGSTWTLKPAKLRAVPNP